jgi:hypothetical protein
MELDGHAFDGPTVQEPNFWSRSDSEFITFEPGLRSMPRSMLEKPDSSFVSGNDNPPVFQVEETCSLADEWCRRNLRTGIAHEEGCDGVSDWSVDRGPFNSDIGYYGTAPSDLPILCMPSADGSSEDGICVGLSSTEIAHFSQGRSLLFGLDHGNARVSNVEAEVAKLLKQHHWLPHRL